MKFVLFRHAQKGFLPFDDPELSAKGHDEALKIPDLILKAQLPPPTLLVISPKRRTAQTFYPTAKAFNLTMHVDPRLDQRSSEENSAQFRNRVKQFFLEFGKMNSADACVYACTHFDVVEEAMALIPCDRDLNTFEFSHWARRSLHFSKFAVSNGLLKRRVMPDDFSAR